MKKTKPYHNKICRKCKRDKATVYGLCDKCWVVFQKTKEYKDSIIMLVDINKILNNI